jgi:catechol 2,3-dioxygenase-like lactoylglutathione lyase family enzyme
VSKAQVFIDHLTLPVRDLEASRSFYRQALAPFGVEEVELWGGIGWGPPDRVDFFIREGEPSAPLHLAFAAADRATVPAPRAA